MKKFIITIGSSLILAAAVFTGFWFYQANQIKKEFIAGVEGFEESFPQSVKFEYGALNVTGYPFSFELNVQNPRFEVFQVEKNAPKIVSQAIIEGKAVIGANLMGSEVWVNTDGKIVLNHPTELKGESIPLTDVIYDGKISAVFTPRNGIDYSNPNFLDQLRLANLSAAAIVLDHVSILVNTPEQEALCYIERGTIGYRSVLKEESRQIVTLDADIVQQTDPKVIKKILTRLFNKPMENEDGIDVIDIGKATVHINSEFQIPQWHVLAKYLVKNPQFSDLPDLYLSIPKLDLNSKVTKSETRFLLSVLNDHSDAKLIKLDYSHQAENSPEYIKMFKTVLIKALRVNLNEALKGDLPPEAKANLLVFKDMIDSPNFEKFLPNLPKKFDANLKFSAALNNQLDFFKPWEATLENSSITFDRLGFSLKGGMTNKDQIHGKATLGLLDYKLMLKYSIRKLNQLRSLMEETLSAGNAKAEGASMPLFNKFSETQREAIEHFLVRISNDPATDKQNLAITIDYEKPGSLKIGTLNELQLMMALQKLNQDLSIKKEP